MKNQKEFVNPLFKMDKATTERLAASLSKSLAIAINTENGLPKVLNSLEKENIITLHSKEPRKLSSYKIL